MWHYAERPRKGPLIFVGPPLQAGRLRFPRDDWIAFVGSGWNVSSESD
jgi:hypothetical protein